MSKCPCESGKDYAECCSPLIEDNQAAVTAEDLMRSRYTAFVVSNIDYLKESLHPDHRNDYDPVANKSWADSSEWLGLEVINTSGGGPDDEEGIVEFKATYKQKGAKHIHHEAGHFIRDKGRWYYADGKMVTPGTVHNDGPKVGRNDPCPCGSGKKYKKCCG